MYIYIQLTQRIIYVCVSVVYQQLLQPFLKPQHQFGFRQFLYYVRFKIGEVSVPATGIESKYLGIVVHCNFATSGKGREHPRHLGWQRADSWDRIVRLCSCSDMAAMGAAIAPGRCV